MRVQPLRKAQSGGAYLPDISRAAPCLSPHDVQTMAAATSSPQCEAS